MYDEMETDVRELIFMIKLSEKPLSGFLESEPDIYKIDDAAVRYR